MKAYLKKIRTDKAFLFGNIIILIVLTFSLFGKYIAPYPFDGMDTRILLQKPSFLHWFGTDTFGRDIFSRIILGTWIAVKTSLIITSISLTIGVTLGIISGFVGGIVDSSINFLIGVIMCIPSLFLTLGIISILGPSLENVIISMALVSWTGVARMSRSKTQSIKNQQFVEAARAFGENNFSIMLRYILPNILPFIVFLMTISIPSSLLMSAGLGFLGLGAQPPSPDWGLILADGMANMYIAPYMAIYPGVMLTLTILGMNLFGEGIRDLLDPKLQK